MLETPPKKLETPRKIGDPPKNWRTPPEKLETPRRNWRPPGTRPEPPPKKLENPPSDQTRPPCGQTDACENITLAKTSFRPVMNGASLIPGSKGNDYKNAFQYDAYRPLLTVRGCLCPGVSIQGVSVTDRCKNITLPQTLFTGGKNVAHKCQTAFICGMNRSKRGRMNQLDPLYNFS